MTAEMIRMREDMHQRTVYMTREMQRYQAAAIGTSQAMMAAKKEMQDRRNDIDTMRAKLDAVMERLYVGEGHNLTLQATIATAQDHAGVLLGGGSVCACWWLFRAGVVSCHACALPSLCSV